MHQIGEYVDDRHKSWCIHCTRSLLDLEITRDHVPSKSFLKKPSPDDLPVVHICRDCNNKFSLDEQYSVAFLSSVVTGSTDPERQNNESAARSLQESPALRSMIEKSRSEYTTQAGERRIIWQPDTERLKRVFTKNARGHAYFELGEPQLTEPSHISLMPLEAMSKSERDQFEGLNQTATIAPWPELGSRMMTRLLTGADMIGPWIIVQQGIYRYSVEQAECLRVRIAVFEYLACEIEWEY